MHRNREWHPRPYNDSKILDYESLDDHLLDEFLKLKNQ